MQCIITFHTLQQLKYEFFIIFMMDRLTISLTKEENTKLDELLRVERDIVGVLSRSRYVAGLIRSAHHQKFPDKKHANGEYKNGDRPTS